MRADSTRNMPVKRSLSESASPPSSPIVTPKSESISDEGDDYALSPPASPSLTRAPKRRPQQTPTKRSKASPATKATSSPSLSMNGVTPPNGKWEPGWSPDKREALVERYLTLGMKASNPDAICQEVSSTVEDLECAQTSSSISPRYSSITRCSTAARTT